MNLTNTLCIMHLNIRSIRNKLDSLKNLNDSLNRNLDIIGLTETWLNKNDCEQCYKLKGYDYVGLNRTNKKGGGVCIYIKEQLNHKNREDLTTNIEDIFESVFIEICTPIGKNIIIGVIYRPPNNKFEIFENAMNELLNKIDRENKICYLMGDFNIDLLQSETCDIANKFSEQLFTSCFYPIITKPTRITEHTATLIDNIFTNNIEKLDSCVNGILFSDISDHLPILHVCDLNTFHFNKYTTQTTNTRVINNANINVFKQAIKDISWQSVFSDNFSLFVKLKYYYTLHTICSTG